MDITKEKYYSLVQQARELYKNSGNISAFLRKSLGLAKNTPEIIEISYDLQAGSYVQAIRTNYNKYHSYCAEVASYLDKYIDSQTSLLEIGCGEATTTSGIFKKLIKKPSRVIGFDISFSRIQVAIDFWNAENEITPSTNTVTSFFVADLYHIPLATKSVDVVYTSHSIEPNGGREVEALKSIFRIAKKRVLLLEPYFEAASLEAQERMSSHGYIKGIPEAISQAGGILQELKEIKNVSNPLNPTYLFDIEIPSQKSIPDSHFWADPITLNPLQKHEDCFYCQTSGLAYPVIRGIPCLRPENSILATQLTD